MSNLGIYNLLSKKLMLPNKFPVKIHGLAAVVSFVNIMRAASLFNERKTFTLLFVMVGYPFLLFTILTRILAVGVITCFLDTQWTIMLFLGYGQRRLHLKSSKFM